MKISCLLIAICAILAAVACQECNPETHYLCDNGKCLLRLYLCDGKDDCGDDSDELKVPEDCPPCDENQFRCGNGHCVPWWRFCDGWNDCRDGSDEREKCGPCPERMFQCRIGGCIHDYWACDGMRDCADWSDEWEETCPCKENESRCVPIEGPGTMPPGICMNSLPTEYWCDAEGIWDCPNGADERNCTTA